MKKKANRSSARRILWIEGIGFSLIILLSWVDELLGLPHLLFGVTPHPDWREAAIESLITLVIWLVVYLATQRVLRRFLFLENLLTMCAWCRKLQQDEHWVSLEDYCRKELGADISHGLCPECGRQLLGRPTEKTSAP
jgi:hypothetical protein